MIPLRAPEIRVWSSVGVRTAKLQCVGPLYGSVGQPVAARGARRNLLRGRLNCVANAGSAQPLKG
jgi:hypothetical protein